MDRAETIKKLKTANRKLQKLNNDYEIASGELSAATEKAKDIRDKYEKTQEKIDQIYKDFVSDLKKYSDNLVQEWGKNRTAPKVKLRRDQSYRCCGNTFGDEAYYYYDAFNVEKVDKDTDYYVNRHIYPSIIFVKDNNLGDMERAVVKDHALIMTDRKFMFCGSFESLSRIIVWIYAFFYRESGDVNDAIENTKKVLEEEYHVYNREDMERNIFSLLFEKYTDPSGMG